jgi:pimeloyl-ACP methyl ester carboxylesterase
VTRWLLLHGVPLSPEVWDEVRTHLPGETIAPDLNEVIASVSRDGLLQQQIAAKILDDTPDRDLIVVGHSFGGQVALELALAAPQRLRRLIIVCSRHTPSPAFELGARAVRAGEPVDIDAGMRQWFTAAEAVADGSAVRYIRRRIGCAPRRPWAAALAATAYYDRSAQLGAIGVPTALFAGGRDEVSPPALMADMAAVLPRAALEVVDDWAHMSPFAGPAAFAARLSAAASPGWPPTAPPDRQLPSSP